jgi:hypothetical protein
MKKLLLTLAATSAVAVAAPAAAQSYGAYGNANATVQSQIVQLRAQLDAGVRTGAIDRDERRRLRQEIQALTRLRAQYASGGINAQEWNLLQQRVGNLSQQIQVAAAYQGNYQYGAAYPNQGYAYDRYGRGIPAPAYGYDQYGRAVQSGYYGQGGPYVAYPQSSNNGVLGNVLGGVLGGGGSGIGGNILGSILGNGGLRIGDVITGVLGSALGGVSSSRYQDRNDVYFRTDGQRVYEIDARTNQVIRIHPMR